METKRSFIISSFILAIFTFIVVNSNGQTPTENYIHSWEVKMAGQTDADDIDAGTSSDTAIQTIQYFDGLGRLIQTVQPSFTVGSTLITPKVYNYVGLDEKNYLPYSDNNLNLLFRDFVTPHELFYRSNFGDDPFGNEPIDYEKSPLNRVLKKGSAGQAWQLSKADSYDYLTNDNSNPKLKSVNWQIDEDGVCKNVGYYTGGELYVTKIVDEDLKETYEFKDKQGQVLLKRSVVENNELIDTYYVYDDFGLLRFVISPEGTSKISDGFSEEDALAKQYVYCYTYDDRKRMSKKQVPGKEPEYFVYDNTDKLVLYQDGNMRKKVGIDNHFEWMFTKYDGLGRVIITGITSNYPNQTQEMMQDIADHATYCWEILNPVTYPDGRSNYYSNRAFPVLVYYDLLTINYYDNYYVKIKEGNNIVSKQIANDNNLSFNKLEAQFTLDEADQLHIAGMPTVIFTKVPGGFLASVTYYDNRGRIIQTRSKNRVGGYEYISNRYLGITNSITDSEHKHSSVFNAVAYGEKETYNCTYDPMGRVLTRNYKTGETGVVQRLTNIYTKLGQLKSKNFSQGLVNMQTIDYAYNIRGWLTSINNPWDLTSGGDFFGIGLLYNEMIYSMGNIACFNGNISGAVWQSAQPTGTSSIVLAGVKGYLYNYDKLNRLKKADFKEYSQGVWSGMSKFNEEITNYDFNGNIKNLVRHGMLLPNNVVGQIDKLTYTYNGNRLIAVDDIVTGDNSGDFCDNGSYYTTTDEYLYDANGNMIKDVNKGIINISYNYQNLPVQIDKQVDTRLEYQYDASGNKLRQTEIYRGGIIKTIDFVGNFVYENGKPAWHNYDEGRVVFNNGIPVTEAYIKDHLGNVRVAFGFEGSLLKVRQVNSYYAFGMNIKELSKNGTNRVHPNEYLYNGKMMQDEQGLNWLDYGARFYDPVLGRWHSVDPLAEKGRRWSPYSYCFDNPIIFEDPDGMWPPGPGFLSDTWSSAKSSFADYYKSAYNTVRHPVNTAKSIVNAVSKMSATEILTAPVRMSPVYQIIKAEVKAVKAVVNGDGKTFGTVIGNQVANTTAVLATAAVGKGISAIKGPPINNPVPNTLARVVPTADVSSTLGPPGKPNVFVTGASDIEGLNSAQISYKLTIPESSSGFTIYSFSTPEGISTPIISPNTPGFIGKGQTAGGAREFQIPNQTIPPDATITTTK